MKSLKVMSIIGIVWFVACFWFAASMAYTDTFSAYGWGIIADCFGLPLAIVGLVQANKHLKE
jgi:hypothetical protein